MSKINSNNRLWHYLLILLVLLSFPSPAAFADNEPLTIKPFWGPFFRTNSFTPFYLKAKKTIKNSRLVNAISSDIIIFDQKNQAEAILKINTDSTLIEWNIANKKNALLPTTLQLIPEEKALVAVLGILQKPTYLENVTVSYINRLPDHAISYDMLDMLYITNAYSTQISAMQMNAIKEFVLKGGILRFDHFDTAKKYPSLLIQILSQTISKQQKQTEDEKKKKYFQTAMKWAQTGELQPVGLGFAGILDKQTSLDLPAILAKDASYLRWSLRNRNNDLQKKNILKETISNRTYQTCKRFGLIYFLLFSAFLFLKPTGFLTRTSIVLAIIAIAPAIYLTPLHQINAQKHLLHYANDKASQALEIEEIFLDKNNLPTISLESINIPYLTNSDAHLAILRSDTGQITHTVITSPQRSIRIRRKTLSTTQYVSCYEKNEQIYLLHKAPFDQMASLNANDLKPLEIISSEPKENMLITKTKEDKHFKNRDHFKDQNWYLVSNQLFYVEPTIAEKAYLFEKKAERIELKTEPSLNIQNTQYSIIYHH